MSLRLRLLLSLLALAAVGLLVVDAVSYSSLRSHLSERVDQQVESARGAATVALLADPKARKFRRQLLSDLPPGVSRRAAAQRAQVVRGAGSGRQSSAPLPQFRPGAGPALPPGGIGTAPAPPPGQSTQTPAGAPPQALELPPGTYGVLRSPKGRTISDVSFGYGEREAAAPNLPASFPVSTPDGPVQTFTVPAGTGGREFRAAAFRPAGSSFTTVVAVPLDDFQDTLDHVALIGAIVTASVLIGLGLLAWWLIRLGLRPLEEIEETAGRIADGDLTERVADANPRTEVGRLGVSLNAMLGQIEEAFEQREQSELRMRRFLADASHELRTPLTSIRGYAEVFRLGAAGDPVELEKAMRRIEDESVRMSAMVNDLMALARLDEIREPVRVPVDLRELASDACDDARVAHPDREISLDASDVRLEGDPDQLRRVIANLLANAAGHTPDGTPIEVRLANENGEAVLSVRDHGPGLSEESKRQVFERFWRASDSRGRESGGAGLGLAIVAGVVDAHDGRVRAENDPGGGAVFTVELPLRVATAT